MKRLENAKTSQSGIDASARRANSRGAERSHEFPRARKTMPSAKRMKPVQQIGVFHDQNGSTCARVAPSETIMIVRPRKISITGETDDTEENSCRFLPPRPPCPPWWRA